MNHLAGLEGRIDVRSTVDRICQTPNQRQARDAFLQALPQTPELRGIREPVDEITALRFLVAEKFDVQRALERLVVTVRWRQENALFEVVPVPCYLVTQRRYQAARRLMVLGRDKDYRVLTYDALANFFAIGGDSLGAWEDFRKCAIWFGEYTFHAMRRLSLECGRPVWQTTSILDCQGCSLSQFTKLPLLVYLDRNCAWYYPESISKIIMINCPGSVVPVVHRGLALMDPGTVSKVEIHAGVPIKRLLELIPADQLPPCFGGSSAFDLPPVPASLEELPDWHEVSVGPEAEYAAALEYHAFVQEDMAYIAELRSKLGRSKAEEIKHAASMGADVASSREREQVRRWQEASRWPAQTVLPLSIAALSISPLFFVLPKVVPVILFMTAMFLTMPKGSSRSVGSVSLTSSSVASPQPVPKGCRTVNAVFESEPAGGELAASVASLSSLSLSDSFGKTPHVLSWLGCCALRD